MSYAPDEGARRKCDANCNFTEELLFLFLFLFFFMGGEKKSHVGHVTLSVRQGEGNHTLPHFPSQIENFLSLLVLFVC